MKLIPGQVPLMAQMAKAVGVNLGHLTPPELAMASLRCAGCVRAGACKSWLEDHPVAPAAPDYCRNADTMARLQAV